MSHFVRERPTPQYTVSKQTEHLQRLLSYTNHEVDDAEQLAHAWECFGILQSVWHSHVIDANAKIVELRDQIHALEKVVAEGESA